MSDLVVPTRKLLADGPLPLKVVAERLKQDGQLDEGTLALVEEEGDEAIGYELEAQLDLEDTIWRSSDDQRTLAWGGQLLDGLVLTHRLTADEVAGDEVAAMPDLTILDWAVQKRLETSDGEPVTLRFGSSGPGADGSVYAGPAGWLADFCAGDLVAFRRRGETVEVSAADGPAADDREVEALRAGATAWIRPGRGEEIFPVMLDALVADPGAFREPVRPVDELMGEAGFERRGFTFGPSGEEWEDGAQRAARAKRTMTRRDFELDSCCAEAYDEVMAALDQGPDPGAVGCLGRALSHGWAPAAVVRDVLAGTSPEPSAEGVPQLAAVGRMVVDGSPGHAAGGRYLVAMEAAHRGDAALAEAELRKAHSDDPELGPVAHELAVYEVDRGDLAAAAALRHLGHPLDREWGATQRILNMKEALEGRYRKVGRNDRCPCGSGRKYKVCCLREPKMSADLRGSFLDLRLHLFARSAAVPGRRAALDMLVMRTSVAADVTDSFAHHWVDDPVFTDLMSFEGGWALRYLAERGPLLPELDRRVLEVAVEEPRRLWRVTELGEGQQSSTGLEELETGRSARLPWRVASGDSVGDVVLWRIVHLDGVDYPLGFPIKVPEDQVAAVGEILAEDSGPDALATWYHTLFAS